MSIYNLFNNDRIFVLGHRGYSEKYPENTMPSFRACVEADRVDGVELDVHECKSGEIVVAHDGNLKRICNIDCFIEDMTWDELKNLDVGVFKAEEFRGTHMPLLEDLFSEFGNSIIYDIEIKVEKGRKYKSLCEKTFNLIRKYELEDYVMVSSFHPLALKRFNRISWYSLPTADIYTNDGTIPRMLSTGKGHIISGSSYLKPNYSQVTEEYIKKYNLELIPWTVNTKEEAERLLKFKSVKGLIGNNPLILAQAVESVR